MIYSRRRPRRGSGFYQLQNAQGRSLRGFGYDDFIRLRDEFGHEWRGQAERQSDHSVIYRFRDAEGKSASGISDHLGILLRDDRGNVWRGFVE
jgi:hypothetical protein